MNDDMKERIAKHLYQLPVYQRKDRFRLAQELVKEDKLDRSFWFWIYQIMYDKFYGYQDTVAKRLMF
jgi:hypothetical protein